LSVILEQAVAEKMSAAASHADSTPRGSPLRATSFPEGVNLTVFFRPASAVQLLLLDREEDALPTRVILIDPAPNRCRPQ
jgi:isoamylase